MHGPAQKECRNVLFFRSLSILPVRSKMHPIIAVLKLCLGAAWLVRVHGESQLALVARAVTTTARQFLSQNRVATAV